mmetsp:Transcript_3377/g.21066  ORF Transcript_3377/g.21066 Transcript_3377/m.21066 type:complete len:261 (+) Transcript_3377:1002-1784(+)
MLPRRRPRAKARCRRACCVGVSSGGGVEDEQVIARRVHMPPSVVKCSESGARTFRKHVHNARGFVLRLTSGPSGDWRAAPPTWKQRVRRRVAKSGAPGKGKNGDVPLTQASIEKEVHGRYNGQQNKKKKLCTRKIGSDGRGEGTLRRASLRTSPEHDASWRFTSHVGRPTMHTATEVAFACFTKRYVGNSSHRSVLLAFEQAVRRCGNMTTLHTMYSGRLSSKRGHSTSIRLPRGLLMEPTTKPKEPSMKPGPSSTDVQL